jgi:hypothetical protein
VVLQLDPCGRCRNRCSECAVKPCFLDALLVLVRRLCSHRLMQHLPPVAGPVTAGTAFFRQRAALQEAPQHWQILQIVPTSTPGIFKVHFCQ